MSLARLIPLLLACWLVCPAWSAAKQPITEGDLLKIERVTEVRVTPDGALAVYGVRSIHTEPGATAKDDPAYSYRVNLWMSDLRDPAARPVQLTYGEENDSNLEISPDGRELAFLRADSKKHSQLWIMPLNHPGEARMITTLENGAENPRWRKDGKALLVASSIPISKLPGKPSFDLERPARDWWDFNRPPIKDSEREAKADTVSHGSPDGDLRSIRDWLEHNSAHDDPADITRIRFLGELSLNGELAISELFRVDLGAEPKTTQLTSSFRNHNEAAFSPQGDQVVFASAPPSHLHPDRLENKSAVWEMNADGSNEHVLLNDDKYAYTEPQFTPDGQHLIVTGQQTDEPTYRQAMLAMCDADGSHLSWLTPDGDPAVQEPLPRADGQVYYTVDYQGGQPLRRVDLKTRKIEDVIAGPVGVNAFDSAGGKIIYAQISAENPNELYVTDNDGGSGANHSSARRLTAIKRGLAGGQNAVGAGRALDHTA